MGGDGKQARNHISDNRGVQLMNEQARATSDPRLLDLMGKYSRGEMKLADALKASGADNSARRQQTMAALEQAKQNQQMYGGLGDATINGQYIEGHRWGDDVNKLEQDLQAIDRDSELNRSRQHQFFTDPMTGTLAATDQVRNNDMFKGVFGEGGLNERILSEEQDLAKRGFSLQPEDHEAYGQAAGETARLFGQEEASLAQALASRGLAAAPSGAAGVGFSGLMGNKTERLAASQRKIADDRMKSNLERLNSARNLAMEGNKLAQAAVGDQYARNRQGVEDYQNTLKNSANAAKMMQDQENVGFEQVEATRGPTFGEIAGGVLGGAASAGIGAATGGLGASLGGGLGKKLGGINPFAKE